MDCSATPVTAADLAIIGINSVDIVAAFSWGFGAVFSLYLTGLSIGYLVAVIKKA